MKKFISILLSVIMIFSLTSIAFAADETVPVIVVSGMGCSLYKENDDGSREKVWGPSSDKIKNVVTDVAPYLLYALVTDDFSDLPNHVDSLEELFINLAHNSDGSPVNDNLVFDVYDKSLANYPDEGFLDDDNTSEAAVCGGIAKAVGAENTYFFTYNWTDGVVTTAKKLNSFVENVKKERNCDKVKLVACSMGGAITMAYLADYGYDSVDTVVLASTAFLGTEIIGQLFTKRMDVSTNSLISYFTEFLGDELSVSFFALLEKIIETYGGNTIPTIDAFFDKLVKNLDCVLYDDLFMDTFLTVPGLWSLIPASYYEEAKDVLFTDREEYLFLETEIDHYIYDVQLKSEEIINKAVNDGVKFQIVATYLCPGIPVHENYTNYTDNLVDLNYASGMATVAPYGTYIDTEKANEKAVCKDESHNHISADLIIDASSCFLPENTWFMKNVAHMSYNSCTPKCDLLAYLASSDEYVNVYSNEKYPQFSEYDEETNTLISLTGYKEEIADKNSVSGLLKLFLSQLWNVLKNLLGIGK